MSEWAEKAKLLRFNEKRKVPHCTGDASAYISNGPRGVSLHCFRCGANAFEPHGRLSAADILRARQRDDAAREQPYPTVVPLREAPAQACSWVLKAFITPERATDTYGFGYDEKTERVVLPVLHDFEPTGLWAARATDGRSPKYLMGKGSAGSMWYAFRQGRPVVVVEDVLSAIRVYEAGYSSVSILGTSVPTGLGTLLGGRDVLAWLDADKAGRNGYVKLRKALSLYGVDPKRVRSDKDPKLHTRLQIQEKLSGS